MRNELEFFASMYLESVCDETRVTFLKDWELDLRIHEDKVSKFRNQIEKEDYARLLEAFRKLMGAKKVVMFQTKKQGDLTSETEYCSITVLANVQEKEQGRIDILRSELLEFYRNHDANNGRPFSKVLLDVKDTVRVVLVKEEQKDLAVQQYVRQPCIIAYVRVDYFDVLHDSKPKHIFFAFFYQEDKGKDMMEILRHIQGFLSFRHNLKRRIEKDFSGNMFGKRSEEIWRIDWLSIEKAGAHTDSSGVNRLIRNRPLEDTAGILDNLFDSPKPMPKDSSDLLKLTYNILIAMYFRAVISAGQEQFMSADNLEDGDEDTYCKVGDLIQFSDKESRRLRLCFGNGQNEEYINNAPLYGASSKIEGSDNNIYTGLPAHKSIAARSKYLQAFMVDILCNIENYGTKNEAAEIYIEDCPNPPWYLVFKNQVVNDSENPENWCKEKNYKLKKSIEFDHAEASVPKGFSLGCTAHCLRWAGNLVASYSYEDEKTYFTIKLPMIQAKEEEKKSNGQITNY